MWVTIIGWLLLGAIVIVLCLTIRDLRRKRKGGPPDLSVREATDLLDERLKYIAGQVEAVMGRVRGLSDLREEDYAAHSKAWVAQRETLRKGLEAMGLYFVSIQEQLTEQKKMMAKFLKRAEDVLKMVEEERKAKRESTT